MTESDSSESCLAKIVGGLGEIVLAIVGPETPFELEISNYKGEIYIKIFTLF